MRFLIPRRRAYRVNFLYFTRVGSMLSGPSLRTLSSS